MPRAQLGSPCPLLSLVEQVQGSLLSPSPKPISRAPPGSGVAAVPDAPGVHPQYPTIPQSCGRNQKPQRTSGPIAHTESLGHGDGPPPDPGERHGMGDDKGGGGIVQDYRTLVVETTVEDPPKEHQTFWDK